MATSLIKHPAEQRLYGFEFDAFPAADSADVLVHPRSVLFDNTGTFDDDEAFQPPLTLPLLFGSMVPTTSVAVLTVFRDDGTNLDITVSNVVASGSQVTFIAAGGVDGHTYFFQVVVSGTNLGNVIVGQGYMRVMNRFP